MDCHHVRSASLDLSQENLSPEYLEIVNYINKGWRCVKVELEEGERRVWRLLMTSVYLSDNSSVKYYQEKSNPALANFSPFDLDAWWGKRLYQNLTNGL